MTRHPQTYLQPPDKGAPVGIDTALVPLITALWEAGFLTITSCQDLGESIGDLSPRKAAYWKGWALIELPPKDARRLMEQAAVRGFGRHWSEPDAWEVSVPLLMLGVHAVYPGIVQVHIPVAQLEMLAAAVPEFGE